MHNERFNKSELFYEKFHKNNLQDKSLLILITFFFRRLVPGTRLVQINAKRVCVNGCFVMLIGAGRCQNFENIGSCYCLYTRIISSNAPTTCNSNVSNTFYRINLNKQDEQYVYNVTLLPSHVVTTVAMENLL